MSNPQSTDSVADPLSGLPHFTARELQQMKLKPPSWIVQDVLPEGSTLLVAKPKVGKTLLAQNIAVAVATGDRAFGTHSVKQGRVLFLALEGSSSGMQTRLNKMLQGQPAPDNLRIVREFPLLASGGLARLQAFLQLHPDTALIVVDTLVRVQAERKPGQSIYQADYKALQPLAQLATQSGVSILIIHHANKREEGDPIDFVSGSTGLTGAVDNVLIMQSSTGANHDAVLTLAAREVDSKDIAFKLDTKRAMWVPQGLSVTLPKTPERQAIIEAIRVAGSPLKPAEIAVETGQEDGAVRVMVREMLKVGELSQPSYGRYDLPPIPP